MDISKYTGYFHDGEIIDIKHVGNNIEILMCSAEVDQDEITDPIPLAQSNFLFMRGRLHIEGVRSIKMNNNIFLDCMALWYKDNDVLDFKIEKNKVTLNIGWRQYKPPINDFSAFEIEAEKIWWENLPDIE